MDRKSVLGKLAQAAEDLKDALGGVEYPNDIVYVVVGWSGLAGHIGREKGSTFAARLLGRRHASELPEDLANALTVLNDSAPGWKVRLPGRLAALAEVCLRWMAASDEEWNRAVRIGGVG